MTLESNQYANSADDCESDPFAYSVEEMREIGYRVIDRIVEHFDQLREKPPITHASREQMDWLLNEALPEKATPFNDVLEHVESNILEHSAHLGHPNFYSFVPSPNNFISTMADALATGYNLFSGAWVSSPGAAELEMLTTNWLLQLFGFPVVEGGGLFVSGGSMANLTAMVAARQCLASDHHSKGTVYWSDQTHSSVERAAKVIGLHHEQVRIVETNDRFELSVDHLKSLVAQDKAEGKQPFLLVANAGTTNTAAVDPLIPINTLCRHHNIWMHVDAAYGGAAVLTPKGKQILAGIELADSITIDPHKWFHQPYEIGCLLVRNHQRLQGTFRTAPAYLRDLNGAAEEVNFYDLGIQLTRRFRALKFYMSVKTYGLETFRKAIASSMTLAEQTEAHLAQHADWEVITPAKLAVLTFRLNPSKGTYSEVELDELNQAASRRIIESGKAMIATTLVNGRTVLRMCLINPKTRFEDVVATLEMLAAPC